MSRLSERRSAPRISGPQPISAPQEAKRVLGWSILAEWWRRARDRAALAEMEPAMLRDIGVSEDARRREVAKPFWRA